ncbi:U32 family peptidase [Leeia sp.]|uniref:U32 family peptidase n=1 Tax=Leeia sp. TaxID=2884678 RepID=UPI0035AE7A73
MEMNISLISVAPVSYYWQREDLLRFYADIAESAAQVVYLGEVVCGRRHQMRLDDWLALAHTLRDAGKTVVLSTQTLIDSESDRRAMHKLVEKALAAQFQVEANDLGAVRVLQDQSFIAGPHLNAYHGGTLSWLVALGASRFVVPLEMSGSELQRLLAEIPAGLQCELQVWGRLALAFSARCFTARHFRLQKDHCEFRCIEYPDGLPLQTREQGEFLTLNGIQTQSAHCLDLLAQTQEVQTLGVHVLRVNPMSQGTLEAIEALHSGSHARQPLPAGIGRCNGYWFDRPGMDWVETA